jgi:hypothetical protein
MTLFLERDGVALDTDVSKRFLLCNGRKVVLTDVQTEPPEYRVHMIFTIEAQK